jgi:cytoskeletal protein RodZ
MPTVGEILAAERRRQGKSLNDVVEGTKVRSRLIDALETGKYDILPSPAYVKGFIQSYARYLEIPCEPLLDQYRKEAAAYEHRGSPADRYLDIIPHETVVPRREQAHAIPRQIWIATAVVVLVVALLICGLTRLFGGGGGTTPTPSAGGTSSEVTASPGAEPTTTVEQSAQGFTVRVTVKKGSATWLNAMVDGLQAYDGTLTGGGSREWLVTDTVVLKIGKPDALTVTRDGVAVRVPRGVNVQVTLKADAP